MSVYLGTSHSFYRWNQVPDDKKQPKGRRVCSGSPLPGTLFIMKGSSWTQLATLRQQYAGVQLTSSWVVLLSIHPHSNWLFSLQLNLSGNTLRHTQKCVSMVIKYLTK